MIYIHSADIIHRDLKSMNIMMTDEMRGKVADYGESREQDTSQTMTSVGTGLWMAPEVGIASRYDSQADVYSFGVVLFEVAKQDLPYRDLGGKMAGFGMAFQVAMKGLRPKIEDGWNEGLKALMKDCYKREPSARPTFAQLADRLAIIVEDLGRKEGDEGDASAKAKEEIGDDSDASAKAKEEAGDESNVSATEAAPTSVEVTERAAAPMEGNLRGIPLWKMIQTDASLFNFGKTIGKVGRRWYISLPSRVVLTHPFLALPGLLGRGLPVLVHGPRSRSQGFQANLGHWRHSKGDRDSF